MPDEKVVRMKAVRSGSPEMPASPAAERATLGAMFINGDAMPLIASIVQPDDFYIEAHRLIYQAALDLYTAGDPVDIVTVGSLLSQRNQLADAGGSHEIWALTNNVPTSLNIATYARTVAQAADRRRLVTLWQRNAMLGYDGQVPPLDAITQLQTGLTGVSERIISRDSTQGQAVFSAADLMKMELPDPHLIVAGLVPEGLTVLGGRPKMGKSWLSLNLALAVAGGMAALGYTSTEQGDVLYLSLEDTVARLRNRVAQCMCGETPPAALDFATTCPRLDVGGLLFLESWIRRKKAPRMLIVDTLAMIRAETNGENGNAYAQDYAAISSLKKLADAHHMSIIVVHHLRKSGSVSDDPLEELSGTNGISGAADNILVLKRPRNQDEGTLTAAGRDIEETELAMKFDRINGLWTVTGQAADVLMTANQKMITQAIKDAGCPLSPKEITEITGLKPNTVKSLVWRMAKGNTNTLVANQHGKYSLATE